MIHFSLALENSFNFSISTSAKILTICHQKPVHECNSVDFEKKRSTPSIILTATAAMAGAHSCLRGHIWLVVIRAFVASHANVSITFFWGQIFKYALRINQGFCLNVSPSNKESDPNVPLQIFGILVKLTWFSHFFREFSFVVIMRFLGGTFGQNLVMGGTKTFWWTGA